MWPLARGLTGIPRAPTSVGRRPAQCSVTRCKGLRAPARSAPEALSSTSVAAPAVARQLSADLRELHYTSGCAIHANAAPAVHLSYVPNVASGAPSTTPQPSPIGPNHWPKALHGQRNTATTHGQGSASGRTINADRHPPPADGAPCRALAHCLRPAGWFDANPPGHTWPCL